MNTQYEIYKEYIAAVAKDKTVLDLACGDGWPGKIALESGAKFVTFADARTERFIKPEHHTNYQQKFIDLNFPETLTDLLSTTDIVIYFGHLYHSNNHKEILDALISSDCNDFFIDTKIDLRDLNIDLDIPTITWYNPEPVNDPLNGWHSTYSHIKVGHPNLSWMLDYFNHNKLEIKLQISKDHVHVGANSVPFHHRIYIFHVTKSNTNN